MRISYTKQFILLHLPRTGVSSVIAALDDGLFVRAPATRLNKLVSKYAPWVPWPAESTYFRTHESACHVRRLLSRKPAPKSVSGTNFQGKLVPDTDFHGTDFHAFHKIAFVRNPYSWLVSLYELVLQSERHRHYRVVSAMDGFGDYVDWEIRRNKRLQFPYVSDRDGSLLIDWLGRYERLAEDAAQIFASIGVAIEPLPHVGRFTRRDYREFYDAATRRKVAAHWVRDLELFGYDFDGLIDPAAPLRPQDA